MDYPNGLLINYLASSLGGISLALYSDSVHHIKYDLNIEPINDIYLFPEPFSQVGGLRNMLKIKAILQKIFKKYDIIIVQMPSIGIWSHFFTRSKKTVIYHVCANVISAANNSIKYNGVQGLIARNYARVISAIQQYLFKKGNNSVIVNGKELGVLYSQCNPLVVTSSSINQEDINTQLSSSNTKELIFVGRPAIEKGIDLIVRLINELDEKGYSLTVVGASQKEFSEVLERYDIELTVSIGKIRFFSYMSWSKGLKDLYRNKSALLIPSRGVEGTPRVIIEAMSQGCPVIASDIGGNAETIKSYHNGILIQNGNYVDLLNGVKRLYNSKTLREKIIRNGLITARINTIREFGDTFIKAIKQYE